MKKSSRLTWLSVGSLAMLFLGGCVNNHSYPTAWGTPPAIAPGDCTDISGSFWNCEADTGVTASQCALIFWSRWEIDQFAPANYFKAGDQHVTIQQGTDTLNVAFWANSKIIAQRELKKDAKNGFSCTTKGIVISNGSDAVPEGVIGYMPGTYTMFKISTGQLIIKFHDAGVVLPIGPTLPQLLIGWIPIYSTDTLWARVDPYKSPAITSHN